MALEAIKAGKQPLYFEEGMTEKDVTAKSVAIAAKEGDETATQVYRTSGKYLGKGLSIIIDILNPEVVIIGSIFSRDRELLWSAAEEEIKKEALSPSADVCKVVVSGLGEQIGDFASIASALL